MTRPTVLRTHIYAYVFCDNIVYVREPIRYDRGRNRDRRRARQNRSPPNSATNHQRGHLRMPPTVRGDGEDMQAAVSRAYWSRNRFVLDAGQSMSVLPVDRDVRHVQQFCLVLRHLPNHYIHLVFERGKWDSWLLPVGGGILGVDDFGLCSMNQDHLKDAVAEYMESNASNWTALDPRLGRGLTCKMLQEISSGKEVLRAVQCQNDYETSQRPGFARMNR